MAAAHVTRILTRVFVGARVTEIGGGRLVAGLPINAELQDENRYSRAVVDVLYALAATSPMLIEGERVHVSVSAGWSHTPPRDSASPHLAAAAQLRSRHDMALAAELFSQANNGLLKLALQPIRHSGDTRRILYHAASVEAAEGLPTFAAIDALDRLGFRRALDNLIVSRVIVEATDNPQIRLGVPVAGASATLDSWWATVWERLEVAPAVAQRLVFEISVSDGLTACAVGFVRRLQGLGCGVALDGFGIGLTPTPLLMALRADVVKIGGAWIETACQDDDRRDALKHLVRIAEKTARTVVATDIRTVRERQAADAAEIEWQQGALWGGPAPRREWLATENAGLRTGVLRSIYGRLKQRPAQVQVGGGHA